MNGYARATGLQQVETSEVPLSRRPVVPAPPVNGNSGSSATRARLNRVLRRMRESELFLKMMLGGFRALQGVGITVIPNHFYWPVPDMRDLEARTWQDNSLPVGFDLNIEEQVRFVGELGARYRSEWSFPLQPAGSSEYHYNNGLFETVDAEMAYSVVRHFKPSRIIEVGGGFSTRIMAAALKANRLHDDREGELITVEPYPGPALKGITNLISTRIQDVDMDLFLSLKDGDILFLDSSHVVSVGSDTVREFLEILPRLNPGVIVHVHDIFLPSDYPREAVLTNLCFWSEQYLLQAFLTFNSQFEILWASSAMQQYHPEILMQTFTRWEHSYRDMRKDVRQYLPTRDRDRVWPSSFWMRRLSA